MDLRLKGLKVILTGGSRGTGRATLELLAAEGADVGFFSRNQDQIDEAAAAYATHGGKVVARRGDLSDLDAYPALLTTIADELGGCDIFIPSASASGSKLATDWDACYKMDVLGTVRGCEALLPYLEKSAHSAIVVLASIAATETFFAPNAFNAIKAALITYSAQLSQAWGPKGIRVNAVSPGVVRRRQLGRHQARRARHVQIVRGGDCAEAARPYRGCRPRDRLPRESRSGLDHGDEPGSRWRLYEAGAVLGAPTSPSSSPRTCSGVHDAASASVSASIAAVAAR